MVYVVDDDRVAAESVGALMTAIGLPSRLFSSAEEFLDAFSRQSPDETAPCGCLILDVWLPGMSGPELHERLIADEINIPTILVSGHAHAEMKTLPKELACLEKPYRSGDLSQLVKDALANRDS